MRQIRRQVQFALLALLLVGAPASAFVAFTLDCQIALDECRNCPGDPGSGNLLADPGERLVFDWTLENIGDEDITGIVALVDPVASDFFCDPDLIGFPDLFIGEISAPVTSPGCTLGESFACGSTLTLSAQVLTDQGDVTASCTIPMPATCDTCCGTGFPTLDRCELATDSCATGGGASGDGFLDPGEDATVDVYLTNAGSRRTEQVRAIVRSATTGAYVPAAPLDYGTILFPEVKLSNASLGLFVDEFVPPASSVELEVEIQEMHPVQGWQIVGEERCSVAIADPGTACLPADPPNSVIHMEVARETNLLRLTWLEAANARRYAIHEGELASPFSPPWPHAAIPSACLLPPPGNAALANRIGDGRALYFLIQARNGLADAPLLQADLDGDGTAESARDADLSLCP